MAIRIYPSVLSADFANMEKEINKLQSADAIHVDVMDNHFVPSITFGSRMVGRIAEISRVPLDVHLMIEGVDSYAAEYAAVGAQSVTFHVEAAVDIPSVVRSISSEGAAVGMALKPGTPLEPYLEFVPLVDLVLIMTVEPGAGGQPFMADMMPKVEALRAFLDANNLDTLLEVDGGITTTTLPIAHHSGADTFVAGSSVFSHGEPATNIEALRHCIPS